MGDELLEVSEKATLSREAAAARLRELADQLSRHNEISFVRGGILTRVKVPATVEMTVEIEVGEESEIEIEISW